VMGQQHLWRVGHGTAPPSRLGRVLVSNSGTAQTDRGHTISADLGAFWFASELWCHCFLSPAMSRTSMDSGGRMSGHGYTLPWRPPASHGKSTLNSGSRRGNVVFLVNCFGYSPDSGRARSMARRGNFGRVGMWRGGGRIGLYVSAPFVWRCLNSRAMTPFPHPAHRTGRALLSHPALGQDITPSHTEGHEQPSDQPPGPWYPSVLRSTRLLATANATT
jgi:hypothetical protein